MCWWSIQIYPTCGWDFKKNLAFHGLFREVFHLFPHLFFGKTHQLDPNQSCGFVGIGLHKELQNGSQTWNLEVRDLASNICGRPRPVDGEIHEKLMYSHWQAVKNTYMSCMSKLYQIMQDWIAINEDRWRSGWLAFVSVLSCCWSVARGPYYFYIYLKSRGKIQSKEVGEWNNPYPCGKVQYWYTSIYTKPRQPHVQPGFWLCCKWPLALEAPSPQKLGSARYCCPRDPRGILPSLPSNVWVYMSLAQHVDAITIQ